MSKNILPFVFVYFVICYSINLKYDIPVIGFFGSLKACYSLVSIESTKDNVIPLPGNETAFYAFTFPHSKALTYGFELAVFLCVAIIATLALHGISKNKPSCLAPMILVQAVIILRTFISVFNLMIHWSNLKLAIAMCTHIPDDAKLWLLNLNDPALGALVFGLVLVALVIKCYILFIIFRCYQVLKIECQSARSISDSATKMEKAEMVVDELPEYKDVQKRPLVTDDNEASVKPPVYAA